MSKSFSFLMLFSVLLFCNADYIAASSSNSASDEMIFYDIPEQWSKCWEQIDKNNKKQYSEYIPTAQYKSGWENSWTDMISMIIWQKEKAPSALQYFRDNVRFQASLCEVPLVTGKVHEYLQHDLKIYMFFLGCQKVKDNKYSAVSAAANELTFMKIIEGKDNVLLAWISKKNADFVGNQPKLADNLMRAWRYTLDAFVLINKDKLEKITASNMQQELRKLEYVRSYYLSEQLNQPNP